MTSQGETQERAVEEMFEKLRVFEEGMKEYLSGDDGSFTNGENLGVLDILMVATFGPLEAHEEVYGIKTIDPERNPLLFSWITALKGHPSVKAITPPHDKLAQLLQYIKRTSQ